MRGVRQAGSLSSLTPEMVKDATLKQFSNMGLCRSLAMCVKEVADRFFDERLPDDLGELDDMDIATRLLDIKGIGAHCVSLGGRACM